MRIVRHLDYQMVRDLCVDRNYYTRGTCDEYDAMLTLCGINHTNPSAEVIEAITLDILSHSNCNIVTGCVGMAQDEFFSHIAYEILNKCCICFLENN